MRKAARVRALGILTLALLCSPRTPALEQNSQKGAIQAGPLPAQMVNAKTVFISNTAPDGMPSLMLQNFQEPNRPYDQLYAAMKSWGRYQLAASPQDADLVLEIHFARSVYTGGLGEGAEFYMSILDAKTHFVLWTFVEPVKGAVRKVSWEKNIDDSVIALVNDLKVIAGAQAGSGN